MADVKAVSAALGLRGERGVELGRSERKLSRRSRNRHHRGTRSPGRYRHPGQQLRRLRSTRRRLRRTERGRLAPGAQQQPARRRPARSRPPTRHDRRRSRRNRAHRVHSTADAAVERHPGLRRRQSGAHHLQQRAGQRAATSTLAPAFSRRRAMAAPVPLVPPLTSARRPACDSSSNSGSDDSSDMSLLRANPISSTQK
jgi:hypothetical protein